MDFDTVKINEVDYTGREESESDIIVEEPLLIIVDDKELVTVMRTPGSDKELAVGFLFSEGLIKSAGDIQMVTATDGHAEKDKNIVTVKLKAGLSIEMKERAYEVRASCGICGQKKVDDLFFETGGITKHFKVRLADLYKMKDSMTVVQLLSQRTRGAHSAALFTVDATDMIACFEDVGRHNALDKLIGHCLINGKEMDDKVLMLSGRTSYEMIAKALRCSIPIVASISAPSSMAVEIAKRADIALAGIVRESTMTLYNRFDDFI